MSAVVGEREIDPAYEGELRALGLRQRGHMEIRHGIAIACIRTRRERDHTGEID